MMGNTKQMADAGAKALVKKLGKRWSPRVWENMGWHYSAQFDGDVKLDVHPFGDTHTVLLNTEPQIVVRGGSDPVEAVKHAMSQLDSKIVELLNAAKELKGCV